VSWKMTWYFCWWRRGCLGHPQALTLVLLGYFLGWHGHPQAWYFVYSSSHLFILLSLHLKTSFMQNFTQFSLATLVYARYWIHFWFSFNSSTTSIKKLATVATSSKVLWSKELKKKEIKRQMQMQIVAEICQNRTAGKDRFFWKSSVVQIKKCKTNESFIITWGICTKNCRSIWHSRVFHEFLQQSA
jgi:hypothetical protein